MFPKVVSLSLSVQNIFLFQLICNSVFRRADIFTESAAATSSILGIVRYFNGATLN